MTYLVITKKDLVFGELESFPLYLKYTGLLSKQWKLDKVYFFNFLSSLIWVRGVKLMGLEIYFSQILSCIKNFRQPFSRLKLFF